MKKKSEQGKKRRVRLMCLILAVMLLMGVVPVVAIGGSDYDDDEVFALPPPPDLTQATYLYVGDGEYYIGIVPHNSVLVRFWDDHSPTPMRQVAVTVGTAIHPSQIPVPPMRYGMQGSPGQVFMGWFLWRANYMHHVNNPNRPVPFNFDQAIWADDGTGVVDLFGSWLRYGNVSGRGNQNTMPNMTDHGMLHSRALGFISDESIVMATADVNVDGVINMIDHGMLHMFLIGGDVVLGRPGTTATVRYFGNGHTSGTVPLIQRVLTPGSITLAHQGSMTKSGHAFGGWRSQHGATHGGGSSFTWNTRINVQLDMTAVWHRLPNTVRIVYHGNGHTRGAVPVPYYVQTPGSTWLRWYASMAKDGYTFGGWRCRSSDTIWQAGWQAQPLPTWSTPTHGEWHLDAVWVQSWQTMFRPVDVARRISSGYGWRTHPISGVLSFHQGIDVPMPADTRMYSVASGRVTFIGNEPSTINGRGHFVVIETNRVVGDSQPLRVLYAHLIRRAPVDVGDSVTTSTLVGSASTGNHLHFSVITNGTNHCGQHNTIDPVPLFPAGTFN